MAAFHNGTRRHGERAIAVVAVDQPRPMCLAIEAVDTIKRAAMWTIRATIGPADGFKMLPRLVLVGEYWVGEVDSHDRRLSDDGNSSPCDCLCQRDNSELYY